MKYLTLAQRISGLNYDLGAMVQFINWIGILGMPLALLSGHPFVMHSTTFQLQWLLRLASILQLSNFLHCVVCSPFVPYRVSFRHEHNDAWMIPCE